MFCAVHCVEYGASSPSFVFPSFTLFADQASLFYTPYPSLLYPPRFILWIISCVVITLPLLTVPLPLATLCVYMFCVCLWWLMAGHWPLPLLGKLCLCPRGLQICATPEPQLQLWAQAGAKSLLLLLLFLLPCIASILYQLWLTLLGHFLPSFSEIVSLSDSHSACHVLSVTPFYPWLPLVCL